MATTVSKNLRTKTARSDRISQVKRHILSASKAKGPLKMGLYGRNGSGKTHFLGSSKLKTLVIDTNEKGTETLSDRKNVDVYILEEMEELDWVYWYAKSGKHDYEVFCIDTVTMLANQGMRWILKDEARDTTRDPFMPDKRHWGKLGEVLINTFIKWRNLPYHIIFTAQEKVTDTEDEETGESYREVHPEISPRPRSVLIGCVGTFGRLYTREIEKGGKKAIERRMLVGPHDKYISKTRIKGLPRIIRNPTLEQILAVRDNRGEVALGEAARQED